MAPPTRRRPGRLALGAAPPWWRRSPGRVGRWVLAAGLGLTAAAVVGGATGQAGDAADGWGASTTVVVARHDLEPGHAITADDVTRRTLPVAAVPNRAFTGDPTGRVVTSPIGTGEIVSGLRLAPDGARGVAALVPDGRRAVAVPIEGTGLHLRVGDHVDVFAPGAGDAGTTRPDRADRTGPAAAAAVVVEVTDTAVTVAVDPSDVAALARALGQGTPVLALIGTG